MNILRQYQEIFLSLFLQIFCFGLIMAFVLVSGHAETSIKIIGSFFISTVLFSALHFRYICMKQTLEQDLQEKSASFSHALRTPLTTLRGIAEIFANEQDNFDLEQRELIRRLCSSTVALKALITEGIDFPDIKDKGLDLSGSFRSRLKNLFSFG